MGAVVLGHEARDVGERDAADALLRARALPVRARKAPKQLEVLRGRPREERQAAIPVLLVVGALAREPVPVEVRERRILLREDAADAEAEALALEVGQVPHVLDEREAVLVQPPARL